jgi:SAM-dependent methyltransferase
MQGWDRHGIELSDHYGETARQKFGDNIFIGPLADYDTDKRRGWFDVVTMQDTLDHMPDPVSAVRACFGLLRPGGMLVVKVHNISCLFARLTGRHFYAIVPPFHLFYFNKRSLGLILGNAGFDGIVFRYLPHVLQLMTIFLRLSQNGQIRFFYKIHKVLSATKLGRVQIRKDLHDILTVFAFKPDQS